MLRKALSIFTSSFPFKLGFSSPFQMSTMNSGSKLSGKVAVVTASTEGIGLAIAKRLATDGASVVVSSRKQDNVDKAVNELKTISKNVSGTPCHVGKADDRRRLLDFAVSQYGGIDILISNAAVNPVMCQILDTPESAWDKIFETNVKAAFLLTQAAVPLLEKRGGGSIVYVASIAAYQPMEIIGAYSVSKTTLLGLTKAVAMQCAPQKIRVNCLCPGIIKTKFSEGLWANPSSKELLQQYIPMRRIGEPDECAGIISFLCSDDATYITGESVTVAGAIKPFHKLKSIVPRLRLDINQEDKSGVVYCIPCLGCNSKYIGETGRTVKNKEK